MKYFSHRISLYRLMAFPFIFICAFAALSLCLCGIASAQDAHYKLVSPAFAAGQSGDEHSYWPVINADGRFIAFVSQAKNLVAFPTSGGGDGQPNQGGITNVFIRDVQSGTTKLVSINRAGTSSGNGTSFSPSISADGRFVTFSSTSSDLVDNDPNGNGVNVFIRDTQTDMTTLVSDPVGTGGDNGSSSSLSSSANGRIVSLQSSASDLLASPAASTDLYVRDLKSGVTTPVIAPVLEFPLVYRSMGPTALSADGRYVIFVYIYSLFDPQAGEVRKSSVARFDTQTGALALLGDTGVCNPGPRLCIVNTFQPFVSADGRFVTFAQTVFGNSASEALLLGDFASLTTTSIASQNVLFNSLPSVISSPRISADGRSVAFSARNGLLPQDTNLYFDVYRYDHDPDPAGVNGVIQFGQRYFGAKEDGGSVTIPVLRNAFGATGTTTVQFNTTDQNATAGTDYVATSGTLTFNPGENVKFITVPLLNDNVGEGVEAFTLILSNPTDGYVVGSINPNATVFIHDSIKPTITIDDVTTTEGGNAVFTVRLSQAPNGIFAVDFSSADNTATAPADYGSTPGSPFGNVFFDVGQKLNTIMVHTNRDLDNESDETFFVNLSPITDDYLIEKAQGVGTIHNDGTPVVEFVGLFGTDTSETNGSAVIAVKRTSGDPSVPFSINYATADDTASERSDYAAAFGTLDFAPGELSKTFTVLLNDDTFVENIEKLTLTLSSPTNGAVLGRSTQSLSIASDDSAPPATNPLDDSQFFVTQQYKDFLNRLPDQSGLDFWTNELNTYLTSCDSLAGGARRQCVLLARAQISTAFFLSIESQQTGYLVYRLYRESFNRAPTLHEFLADTQQIGRGVVVGTDGWEQRFEANKQKFADDWVKRPDFRAAFDSMSNNAYVSTLFLFGGGDAGAEADLQQALASGLNAAPATETRATVLRKVADSRTVFNRQYNPGLVLMQYFTYLRRNPDDAPDNNLNGYNFWLAKLDAFSVGGEDVRNAGTALARIKRAQMVEAFVDSAEYRGRLGP